MHKPNDFDFVSNTPSFRFCGSQAEIFLGNHGKIMYVKSKYEGEPIGHRSFIIEDNGKYRWVGFTTNYLEKFDVQTFLAEYMKDIGYNKNHCYFQLWGTLLDNTPQAIPSWEDVTYTNFGNVDTDKFKRKSTNVVQQVTFNDYNINNKYDLVWSKSASNIKCWKEKDTSTFFYGGAMTWHELHVASEMYETFLRYQLAGTLVPDVPVLKNNNKLNTAPATLFQDNKVISTGYVTDVRNWDEVLANDQSKYMTDDGSVSIENYSMIDGMPFLNVKKMMK